MIDLHMHSTGSDGQYSPDRLIQKAFEAGLTTVAITDHDSVSGLTVGRRTAEDLGMKFINGIEISCAYIGEMHMLGYGIDPLADSIRSACKVFVEERDHRAERIIDYLSEYGIKISLKDVADIAGGQVIARPHFARAMFNKGYVASIQEAFDNYLATNEFSKIERSKPTPEEGIKIIHKAGGKAVLAHPMSLDVSGKELDTLIYQLTEAGLDGIETYYGEHTDVQVQEYHSIAERYGLLETMGSDYHGEKVKPHIELGKIRHCIPTELIRQIYKKLTIV